MSTKRTRKGRPEGLAGLLPEAARALGFETEVIEAACRSIDLQGSADATRKSFSDLGIVLA